jgi:hypothetical protein
VQKFGLHPSLTSGEVLDRPKERFLILPPLHDLKSLCLQFQPYALRQVHALFGLDTLQLPLMLGGSDLLRQSHGQLSRNRFSTLKFR